MGARRSPGDEIRTSSVTVTGTWSDGPLSLRASRVILKSLMLSFSARDADVVEAAAAIAYCPVGGAIAPPRVDLLGERYPRATSNHSPWVCAANSFSHSIGVCETTFRSCLCDHVVLVRCHVEIADQDVAIVAAQMRNSHAFISSRNCSLCSNFGLSAGSGMSPPAGT